MKPGDIQRLVYRRHEERAEERQADLTAMRVTADQKVDVLLADLVDDVGMMAEHDAHPFRAAQRGIDVGMAAIDLVDAGQRQASRIVTLRFVSVSMPRACNAAMIFSAPDQ